MNRVLTLTLTITLLGACRSDSAPTPAVPPPPTAAPQDPVADAIDALRAAVAALPPPGPEGRPAREAVLQLARDAGEGAITASRAEGVAQVAAVAREAGEDRFAAALLQRAVGLLDPAVAGKDHLWALARLRQDEGRVVEAVSLLERAAHVEPTSSPEWIGLSRAYLLADRVGPARAAVTRGLRQHPDDRALRVQGAEVMLISGRAEQALGIVDGVLSEVPDDQGARLLRGEALLVLGRLDDAADQAAALGGVEDPWAEVLGGAVAAARGDGAEKDRALTEALRLAGDCPCTEEERRGVAWARGITQGEPVQPRSRVHPHPVAPPLSAGSAGPASSPPPR